jgi:hypothetical protein
MKKTILTFLICSGSLLPLKSCSFKLDPDQYDWLPAVLVSSEPTTEWNLKTMTKDSVVAQTWEFDNHFQIQFSVPIDAYQARLKVGTIAMQNRRK